MVFQIEGTFRSHRVPILVNAEYPKHVKLLENWMKSYKAEELFDDNGKLIPELAALAPKGNRRMDSNPHANGGHDPPQLLDFQIMKFMQRCVSVRQYGFYLEPEISLFVNSRI